MSDWRWNFGLYYYLGCKWRKLWRLKKIGLRGGRKDREELCYRWSERLSLRRKEFWRFLNVIKEKERIRDKKLIIGFGNMKVSYDLN